MTGVNDQHVAQPQARLQAGDIMTRDVVTVLGTTTLGQAMTLLRTCSVRHLPVLVDGRFVGLVDDRLVAFALLAAGGFGEALERPVSAVMTHYVPQVAPKEPLQRVAHLLTTSGCGAIVVIDAQERLLGLITMVDVVNVVALHGRAPGQGTDLDDRSGPGRGPSSPRLHGASGP